MSGDRVRNIVRNSEMHEWRWVQGNGGEYQFNYKTKRQIFRVEGAPVMMIYWAHRRLTALSQIIIYTNYATIEAAIQDTWTMYYAKCIVCVCTRVCIAWTTLWDFALPYELMLLET